MNIITNILELEVEVFDGDSAVGQVPLIMDIMAISDDVLSSNCKLVLIAYMKDVLTNNTGDLWRSHKLDYAAISVSSGLHIRDIRHAIKYLRNVGCLENGVGPQDGGIYVGLASSFVCSPSRFFAHVPPKRSVFSRLHAVLKVAR
jgi:hypothetical protein